jgi:hypothetical protein
LEQTRLSADALFIGEDKHPSASINTQKELFHCFTCDIGLSEEQFIAKVHNIPLREAIKYKEKLNNDDLVNWDLYTAELWSDSEFIRTLNKWGISNSIIEETKLGLLIEKGNKYLAVPVFFNNAIMDIRVINILRHPDKAKVRSKKDAEIGFVVPYDVWKASEDVTYIFEGEKDMLIAREQGINAITLTGGAGATLNDYVLGSFKDREVIICYDNDEAGRKGMKALFKQLTTVTDKVKYVDISELVEKEKEDFYDFITLYDGDIFEFLLLEQKVYPTEDEEEEKVVLTSIIEALSDSKINKDIVSEVTVTSEFSSSYIVPTMVRLKKLQTTKASAMVEGEERIWELNMKRPIQMLELMEEDAKKNMIANKLKGFAGIPDKEPDVEMSVLDTIPVYKASVIYKDADGISISIDLYSFERLTVGNQYRIHYNLSPHPTKQQKVVGIVSKVKSLSELTQCIPDPQLLKYFQGEDIIGTLMKQYESIKHYIAKHLDFKIWLMTDLVFNSLLNINYDGEMRGALDVFYLGDTHVRKI